MLAQTHHQAVAIANFLSQLGYSLGAFSWQVCPNSVNHEIQQQDARHKVPHPPAGRPLPIVDLPIRSWIMCASIMPSLCFTYC